MLCLTVRLTAGMYKIQALAECFLACNIKDLRHLFSEYPTYEATACKTRCYLCPMFPVAFRREQSLHPLLHRIISYINLWDLYILCLHHQ